MSGAATDVSVLPGYAVMPEPSLLFHPERQEDRHTHPLIGLTMFGPYSRSLVGLVMDPIRVGVIVPHSEMKKIDTLLADMETVHRPKERPAYLVDFPGFSRLFGLRAVRSTSASIELREELDHELRTSDRPHVRLAESLVGALSALQSKRTEFDVVLILLPQRWEHCFWSNGDPDFDLHDYLKAVTAARGVPIQLLREERVFGYACRCSVLWRLSIAIYTKAGGIPWKLADAEPETAFVGLSYAIKNVEGGPRFVTCCSQVFDADGGGLEFIAYETGAAEVYGKNPYLSRSDMRKVMARSLSLYQRRHAGRAPKQVIVHKTTPFKLDERDGCFDAWTTCEGVDLVQIQDTVPWRGINVEGPTKKGGVAGPGGYPCERGITLALGSQDILLWTQGDAPRAVGGRHFYKEGKGIPEPLLLTRHAGHRGWSDLGFQILGLTKMDWNNDSLYDRLPVTLSYAKVLAGVVKRMPHLSPIPYQFRFFM